MPEDQTTLSSALSERQRAIEHGAGPLLVIGAPGTGKTELLARRLAHLVASPPDSELRPANVLTTASSPRAAASTAEMSSSLSTACWSSGPTCGGGSPSAGPT